jgi:hypothetical protein
MAYNTNIGKQSFTAFAGQTEFDINFKVFKDTDLLVYQTLAGQNPNDATDILILATNYTVTITGDTGGKVTLNSGASVNDTIVIQRSIPIDREIEYQISGDLRAEVLNDDQDSQTYKIADIKQEVEQAIRLPDTAINVSTQLPDVIGDAYLRWDAAGTKIENDTTVPDAVGLSAASAAAALVSENNAATSETNAAISETNASNSAAAALVSENNAGTSETNAGNSETATAADLVATNQDTIDTAADLIATNQDTIDTAADVVSAGTNATNSQLKAWDSEAEAMTSESYATEAEDVNVKTYISDGDGTFTATVTTDFSALHWAAKSVDIGIGEFIGNSIAISSDDTALANDDGTDNLNIGIGQHSLANLTTGILNIGVGQFTVNENVSASSILGIGSNACRYVTATGNIGIGLDALRGDSISKLTGVNNIGIGFQTGYNLTTGQYNVLGGYQAGLNLTTGQYNVLNGYQAGLNLKVTEDNIGIGRGALKGHSVAATTCNRNVGISMNALQGLTTGSDNISIGNNSGFNLQGGSFNLFIGEGAGRYSDSGTTANTSFVGQIVIGRNAYATATSEMSLGNSAHITAAFTAAAWTTRSDEREKDFYDMDLGLGFVRSLSVKKYRWKDAAESADKESYFYGFSAQDVKANLPKGEKHSMHKIQGDKEGMQNLTYTEMIAPLYKAIQELADTVDAQALEIKQLKGL